MLKQFDHIFFKTEKGFLWILHPNYHSLEQSFLRILLGVIKFNFYSSPHELSNIELRNIINLPEPNTIYMRKQFVNY